MNGRNMQKPLSCVSVHNMNTISLIKKRFQHYSPDREIAKKAIRHLKKTEKKQLFSDDLSQMRAAEGRWYESLIYEIMLDISMESDHISGLVRKGADAPFPTIEVKMGQNGLFFSNRGDINIRGNGQDIAEVDLLFTAGDGRIGFAEIVTSGSDLRELEEEVHYKKSLLGYLYGQPSVPFILFSSVDISRSSVIRRLVKETESVLIMTRSCEELKPLLKRTSIKGIPRQPIRHPKLIDLSILQPRRQFNYKNIHDRRKDRLMKEMMKRKSPDEFIKKDDMPPIVKKILFGAVHESASKLLWEGKSFKIKEKRYTYEEISKEFSKVVLAIDLPAYEPVIYLRSKKKKEYLKVVVRKSGGFRVESKRTPRMTGFFLWLEILKPSLGPDVAERYAEIFLQNA